jgi:hypothetical protein
MLKNKRRISSNCSFQISRVSNQNRLHLCHDRLWSSGDVCIFCYTASATTLKTVSELTGTQSFPTPSHSFFIGNSSLLSLCFSWHSFVMACNVCPTRTYDFRDAQLAQLASFPSPVCSRLDLWGERRASVVAASPGRGWTPLHQAAEQGHVEVVALLLKSGASVNVKSALGRRPQSCRSHGTVSGRRADDKLPFSCHSDEAK